MQIATAIVHDISRGRLRAGNGPGTRTLAAKLGVNRVTVSGAYNDELAAEGWIISQAGRGSWPRNGLHTSQRQCSLRANSWAASEVLRISCRPRPR